MQEAQKGIILNKQGPIVVIEDDAEDQSYWSKLLTS